jgi:hypothetical protein
MASLSLDTIISASTFFAGKWEVTLKRSQARDVLRAVLNRLYGASQGNLFHARMRCSHAALAASVGLSREWTCTLVSRLRQAGWIETHAPRRSGSQQQDISQFRPGRMLKRLLVMLLKSLQKRHPQQSRVNTSPQKFPTKEEIAKNLHFLSELRQSLLHKLGPPRRAI